MIKDLEADTIQKLSGIMEPKSRLYLIMYEQRTGNIVEISESVQKDFGLRASTFHGQSKNSVTLHQLCPELLDISRLALLRSKPGAAVIFDTSSLRDTNYWMAGDDDDDDMLDDDHDRLLGGESAIRHEEDEIRKTDFNRLFRKASCQAWVCFTQVVEDKELVCLRFVELASSGHEVAVDKQESLTEQEFGRHGEREEISSDEESDEELAQIKNFRTVLNNNSSSKSIAYMRWIICSVALVYVGLFIFVKWFTDYEQQEIRDISGLYLNLIRRNWLMSDSATSARLFEMTVK